MDFAQDEARVNELWDKYSHNGDFDDSDILFLLRTSLAGVLRAKMEEETLQALRRMNSDLAGALDEVRG